MKIKWLIQDVGIRWEQLDRKLDVLQEMNEEMAGIGVIEYCPYISGLSEALVDDLEYEYVFLSGVKVLKLLKDAKNITDVIENPTEFQKENGVLILEKLKAAIFYDIDAFDQKVYAEKGLPLLNSKADYLPIKNNLKTKFSVDKFIKPSKDLKSFDAGILPAGIDLEEYLKHVKRQASYIEEDMVVAPVKVIRNEYRFFVVDKKVVAGSGYRLGGRAQEHTFISEKVWQKAKEYAKLYQPNDVFTLDLALTEDEEILIVEYNCFNASGVYCCNLFDTFNAIKAYKIKKGLTNV